jgi:hypothetical protein
MLTILRGDYVGFPRNQVLIWWIVSPDGFVAIGIAVLGNVPALNVGLLISWGVPGLLIGFIGFYMIADALFGTT